MKLRVGAMVACVLAAVAFALLMGHFSARMESDRTRTEVRTMVKPECLKP